MTEEKRYTSLETVDSTKRDILYNFVILFSYAKTDKEKDEIISSASLKASLSKKDTYEILRNERAKVQSKYTTEMAELSRDNNTLFIEKYKIKEQIPQDQLPCVFGIDMFGRVNYSRKGISDLKTSTKNLQFISKIDTDYKCVGFRT